MSEGKELGRFGHHPDPAIDYCVEVEEIEAIATDRDLKFANPNDSELESRVLRAMAFRVGGDLHAINAKDRVRKIAAALEDDAMERADRIRAAAPELYEALRRLDAFWTECHPAGPDYPMMSRGENLSAETVSIWKAARKALLKASGGSDV